MQYFIYFIQKLKKYLDIIHNKLLYTISVGMYVVSLVLQMGTWFTVYYSSFKVKIFFDWTWKIIRFIKSVMIVTWTSNIVNLIKYIKGKRKFNKILKLKDKKNQRDYKVRNKKNGKKNYRNMNKSLHFFCCSF